VVAKVLEPVGRDVIVMRHGWLLWAGSAVGVWTVSSLIETIRDILRRAYGTQVAGRALRYRLLATGMVMAVVALLISLYLQVAIAALELARITLRPMAGPRGS
jgi:membrane protein